MSSKSPTGTVTSTQNTSPWGPQQPYLQDIFSGAQNLYQNDTPQYYPGSTYAGLNQNQNQAINDVSTIANNDPVPGVAAGSDEAIAGGGFLNGNPGMGAYSDILGGQAAQTYDNYLGSSNPIAGYLQPYLSGSNLAAGNPNTTALANSVLAQTVPSIESQFINGGGLSSPDAAYSVSQGANAALAQPLFQQYQQEEQNQINSANLLSQSQLGAASGLSNTQLGAAGGLSSAFGQGLQEMLQGIGLAPTADQGLYGPAQQLYGAGTNQQQDAQNQLNSNVAQWNYGQTLPYNQLNEYIGQVTGNYGGTTQLTQPYFGSNIGSTLGNAALGGVGKSLGSALGGSLLSDRRLKTDIVPVGELDNGLTVYAYRYKDEPEEMRHIGLMADEVEDDHPDAVQTLPGYFGSLAGFKAVDYARAVQ